MSVHEIEPNFPRQDIIDLLEHCLERAKKGELRSIAYAFTDNKRCTGNAWAGMDLNNMAMIGEVTCLQQELLDFFVERRKQPIFYEEE